MPKIVDHEAYRQELSIKAIDIFTEHGFNGLGMRGIADALGISKSALYHYFPSKEELFKASTEMFLAPKSLYGLVDGDEKPQNSEQLLTKLITVLESRFRGEMTLLLDYTKNKSEQQLCEDQPLMYARQQFKAELAKIVGEENADQALAILLGGLTMRLLVGKQTDIATIASWILALSSNDRT